MNATPDPPRDDRPAAASREGAEREDASDREDATDREAASNRKAALGRVYDEHGDKLRFLVVGMVNTAISYVGFVVLLALLGPSLQTLAGSTSRLVAWVGEHYYVAVQWIGWVFMVPVSATTMKVFAFRSPGRWWPQVIRAYFVYLPAQGLSSVLLWLTVQVFGLSPQLGQLVTIAFATVFSYLGHKYFTFRLPLEVGEVPAEELLEPKAPRD